MRFPLTAFWLLSTSLCAAGTASAQNPFAGTWKLNQEKSQMTGDILKFGPADGHAMELTWGGTTYSFRTDGKTYALPSGDAAVWRQTAANRWTTEYRKLNNKLVSSDHWEVSADGKMLTVTTSGAKANGDLYTDTAVYLRTAGGSGLLGTWRSTSVALSSPNELTIQELGLDRLVFRIAAMKAHAELTLDGKEAAVQGPDIPTGLRLSLTRTGPYTLHLVQTMNGTTTESAVYTVAADDPKVMTQVGGSPGDPPATLIWEKQAAPAAKPEKTAPVGAPVRP